VNSSPKTVTRQRRGCDLNPGPSAPESSTLTTRLPSHPVLFNLYRIVLVSEFLGKDGYCTYAPLKIRPYGAIQICLLLLLLLCN